MLSKRDLLKDAFDCKKVDKIPIGFWHHFILGKEQFQGVGNKEIQNRAIEGHKKYYNLIKPDIMKLMNEGFMGYPPIMDNELKTAEDLLKIKSISEDDPWFTEQVSHVKKLVDLFGSEVMTFYNVFAPVQVIRIRLEFYDLNFERFVYLAENFPEELSAAGKEIEKDLKVLLRKLFSETKLDGIYYCVQNVQSSMYTKEIYDKYIRPAEISLLEFANELSDYNILHICGYAHHKNNFEFYKDYKAKVYNWAVFTEGISLPEGKKFFGDKCVLGGFDNNKDTLIDKGSKEEIYEFVKNLIKENGYHGYVMGADCSIPNDIDDERISWIQEAATKNKLE